MKTSDREFKENDGAVKKLHGEELKTKIEDAKHLLSQLADKERKLQERLNKIKSETANQDQGDPYMEHALKKAKEIAAHIEKEKEKEINEMASKVIKLKAFYDKEIKSIQGRLKRKKQYIVAMLQSLAVFLDEGDLPENFKLSGYQLSEEIIDDELLELLKNIA